MVNLIVAPKQIPNKTGKRADRFRLVQQSPQQTYRRSDWSGRETRQSEWTGGLPNK